MVELGLGLQRLQGRLRRICGRPGLVGLNEEVILGRPAAGLVARLADPVHSVVALVPQMRCMLQVARHAQQEDRRGLTSTPRANETSHGLGEVERRRSRRGIDTYAQPRDVNALGDHPYCDHPALVALRELLDLARGAGIAREHDKGPFARDAVQILA